MSEPHKISEPMKEGELYRRYQMAEGQLVEARAENIRWKALVSIYLRVNDAKPRDLKRLHEAREALRSELLASKDHK